MAHDEMQIENVIHRVRLKSWQRVLKKENRNRRNTMMTSYTITASSALVSGFCAGRSQQEILSNFRN